MFQQRAERPSLRGKRPQRRFRLVLERLEDRLAPAGDPFVEPPVIMSQNGVLSVTLTEQVATPANPVMVGDTAVINAWTYNGSYAGPTLWAQPGDLLDIVIENELPSGQTTNLHTHGLHVSPIGNGDNVLLNIEPGESNHYQIRIPQDHPFGLNWYHPHRHGDVNDQISMGLSGLLVIGQPDGGASQLANLPQNLLGLKNALLAGNQINIPAEGSDVSVQTFTVNGQLQPVLTIDNTITNNQWQVFNVGNLGNNAFYTLQVVDVTGGGSTVVPMLVVAEDGNPFTVVQQQNGLGVPPGRRWSFVLPPKNDGVDALPGTYEIQTLGYNADDPANIASSWPPTTLMTISYSGTAPLQTGVANMDPLTPPNNYFHDLSLLPVAATRTVQFSMSPDFELINNQPFPNNPIFQPRLGTVEEWNLVNTTTQDHPFHLHTNPQQNTSTTGALNARFTDITNVPGVNGPNGGMVTIRVEFLDFLGTIVYHCHRVDHEDDGMMAMVTMIPEVPIYALGANAGQLPRVKAFNPVTGLRVASFLAFSPSYRGGVSVAVGDVNGDGVYDVIVGKLSGRSWVKVIDGTKLNQVNPNTGVIRNTALLGRFLAYSPEFRGGVFVAAGYINGDDKADVITGQGEGGEPRVKVIDATRLNQVGTNFEIIPNALLANFLAFGPSFRGGVRVASGDISGDGRWDIIAAKGPGGDPRVKVIDGFHLTAHGKHVVVLANFLAYGPNFRGGVWVATGNIKGFAYTDIITGAGAGGAPRVKVFTNLVMPDHESGHQTALHLTQVDSFLAYAPQYRGGVRVTSLHDPVPVGPFNSSRDDVVTTKASGDGTIARIFPRTIPPPPP